MKDFENIFKRFSTASSENAMAAASDLADFPLPGVPTQWESILTRLSNLKESSPKLELALAHIGIEILPVLEKVLRESNIETAPALLRIIHLVLGRAAIEHFRRFAVGANSASVTALWCLSHYEPIEAHALILALFKNELKQSNEALQPYADALLVCALPASFELIKDALTLADSPQISYDTLDQSKVDKLLSFAHSTLSKHLAEGLALAWPNNDVLAHVAFSEFSSKAYREYLIDLAKVEEWWVRRGAIEELAKRGDPMSFELLRKECTRDKFIAETALNTALQQENTKLFDYFSEEVECNAALMIQDLDSPFEIIWSGILRNVAGTSDGRWKELAKRIHAVDPLRSDALNRALARDASDLLTRLESSDPKDRNSALLKLGQLQHEFVVQWITKRLADDTAIERRDYFDWIEALRLLGSASGAPLVNSLMSKCKLTGFALDYALETVELLSKKTEMEV